MTDREQVELMSETNQVLRERGGTYSAARRIARERLAAKAKGAAKPATSKPATAAANADAPAPRLSAGAFGARKSERPDQELARRAAELAKAEGVDIRTAQHRVLARDKNLNERVRSQLVRGA